MGGRVAEDLIFGHEKVTTGAANDIAQATEMARKMVTVWGMSDKLGPLRYTENQEEVFLGHSVTQHKTERSEEHTSELQSLMRISYAVFCLKKKIKQKLIQITRYNIQNNYTIKQE